MQKNKITMQIKSSNPVDYKAKVQALEKIAMLDVNTLNKLGEMASSTKAVASLNDNWPFIKQMVM